MRIRDATPSLIVRGMVIAMSRPGKRTRAFRKRSWMTQARACRSYLTSARASRAPARSVGSHRAPDALFSPL
jgi:ribosomal protein L19E